MVVVRVRPAMPTDAVTIRDLVEPYANHEKRILIPRDLVGYYEEIPEFLIAEIEETGSWVPVGCGALHIMWQHLGEVRTLAVHSDHLREGVGHALLERLIERAREYDLREVFCLTFEVDFFVRHGFQVVEGPVVEPEVFLELLRSYDNGVAEFLDLARVKPNTLGNTRMLLRLEG
ncbi:MAG: amino-acid N-acetyltransferase [Actinomycetota bacterium]